MFVRTASEKQTSRLFRSTAAVGLVLMCSLSLAACTQTIGKPRSNTAQSSQLRPGSADMQRAIQYWNGQYSDDPKSSRNILNYAAALRMNRQTDQAEAILRRGVITNTNNTQIAASYGKVLAENGKLKEALNVIGNTLDPTQPNWRLLSAKAAILDQLGETDAARNTYQQALKISPQEPSVLNNLGMSYLLAGELPQAETTLRTALETGKASPRVRQNLALTVGLQGRYKEAEAIAKSDISPVQAAENIAYLKAMLGKV